MSAALQISQPAADDAGLAPVGDAGSREALTRFRQNLHGVQATKVRQLLNQALAAAKAQRFADAARLCQQVLGVAKTPDAWHLLAIAREKLGDWPGSIAAYEAALALKPDDPEIVNDLGRLAFRMGMYPQAEAMFRFHAERRGHAPESSNNLANLLRGQSRFEEAIEVLRPAIEAKPDDATLWNNLGAVLNDMGDMAQAELFFTEALRLDPKHLKARYNRANTLFANGSVAEAIKECRTAIAAVRDPADGAMMRYALAEMLLASGRLEEGWAAYEARLDPNFPDPTAFLIQRPRWTPDQPLAGVSLLLVGEQGLGDEVLFGSLIPDLLEELGPEGRLTLAVEPRLAPLFQRSFPQVRVGAHRTIKKRGTHYRGAPFLTDPETVDVWAPMGDLLQVRRRTLEAFPAENAFLRPDTPRVDHWRGQLAARPGLKVGLLWSSMTMKASRRRHYATFEDWAPVLRTPGVSFVNLQYGDCSAEIARAREAFGIEILQPEGVDLKKDLDEVTALCAAVDLVIGPANATSNLAGGAGAPLWLLSPPRFWTRLGTDRFPWYPQTRVFTPPDSISWGPLLEDVAQALAQEAGR
jgi:tetratricopeptide (TPR) repeat protein